MGWDKLCGARAEAGRPMKRLLQLPRGEMKVAWIRKVTVRE